MQESARAKLAKFTGARSSDLVFVMNATMAVNTVFRSLKFKPGDKILITSHIYPACRRILEYVCETTGAVLVEAAYPFPVRDQSQVTGAILAAATSGVRIALIDHITSATALLLPVEDIVKELEKRGIDTMVDGAHALGSTPVDLNRIGAAYYTANCHKWLCGPKTSAILHVRADKQKEIVPAVISHAGAHSESFAERFFWPATFDPSPLLCAAEMVDYFESLLPGGWHEVMERNRHLCLEARQLICDQMGTDIPSPDSMIASMATIPLPTPATTPAISYKSTGKVQDLLFEKYRIEVPVWFWGDPMQQILRISAQLYNSMDQYRYLSECLVKEL